MVIFQGPRRFEITVELHVDAWQATLREFVPGRLSPTQHLLRAFDTRQAAIDALRRKWQVLFPDDAPLVWRDPPQIPQLHERGKRPNP
ncbi:hypothetical protein NKDENANG_02277 [Candidatus Entotheonellaceae bacterium PAL068K]